MTSSSTMPANSTVPTTCRVLVVRTDGTARDERWPVRPDGSILAGLQEAVGGRACVMSLRADVGLWISTEGPCEPNPVASLMASSVYRWTQPYFGTAVFTGGSADGGRSLSLGDEMAEALLGVAARAAQDPERVARMTAAAEEFFRRFRR